jgi:nitrogen fixation protein NifT
MKVTVNNKGGVYTVYVPKKDMEEAVTEMEDNGKWGGRFTLANGWVIDVPLEDSEPKLPKTMNVKVISKE